MIQRIFKLGTILSALALMLVFGSAVSADAAAAGGGGGGKPPPQPSPSANPVIAFNISSAIGLADENGENQTIVYKNATWSSFPTWCSPDGTDVVFPHDLNGIKGIYRLQVIGHVDGVRTALTGQAPTLITLGDSWGRTPCSPVPIGPESNKAVKVVFHDGNNKSLFLSNLDGSGGPPIKIVDGVSRGWNEIAYPHWSPDGKRILFQSRVYGLTTDTFDYEIVTLEWDAEGNVNPLCCDSLVQGVDQSPLKNAHFNEARWSHNGDRIVAKATSGLWIIPVANPENAYRVAYDNHDVIRADPAWSPDESKLIYMRNPRRGMCGEGTSQKIKGFTIAVSNLNNGDEIIPIDKNGLSCDEVSIIPDARAPDWWKPRP